MYPGMVYRKFYRLSPWLYYKFIQNTISFFLEGNCSLTCTFSNKIHKSLLEYMLVYYLQGLFLLDQLPTLFSGHHKEERGELGREVEGRA